MATIKELEKQIAIESDRVKKLKEKEALENKKRELSRELFRLKNRRAIASAGKLAKFLRKTGKAIGPAVRKQAQLIRDQQLRDEAIARRIKGRKPIEKPKTRIKKTRTKIKRRTPRRIKRESRPTQPSNDSIDSSLFSNLDF